MIMPRGAEGLNHTQALFHTPRHWKIFCFEVSCVSGSKTLCLRTKVSAIMSMAETSVSCIFCFTWQVVPEPRVLPVRRALLPCLYSLLCRQHHTRCQGKEERQSENQKMRPTPWGVTVQLRDEICTHNYSITKILLFILSHWIWREGQKLITTECSKSWLIIMAFV